MSKIPQRYLRRRQVTKQPNVQTMTDVRSTVHKPNPVQTTMMHGGENSNFVEVASLNVAAAEAAALFGHLSSSSSSSSSISHPSRAAATS